MHCDEMRLSHMLPASPSNPHPPLHLKTPPRNREGSTMTPGYHQSPPSTPSNSYLTNTPTAPETPSDVQAWAQSPEEPS